MSNKEWKNKWKRNDIGFHQPVINPLLERFLPALKVPASTTILVPLCGKSLDMDLLADQGFQVMGIELSDLAIQSFFRRRKVKPTRRRHGRFTVWQHHNIALWCGDIFDLTEADLAGVGILYDCASLSAFPAELRSRYVEHFRARLPSACQILLITIESPEEGRADSVHWVDTELKSLYGAHYQIELIHGQNGMTHDPEHPENPHSPMQEKVYLIKPDRPLAP